jgi:hypothetical protein
MWKWKMNPFHMKCLELKMLKLNWQDMVPDTEVLRHFGMISIHTNAMQGTAKMGWPCG